MRRHSIIARLGPGDTDPVPLRDPSSVLTEIGFIDGYRRLQHGLGQAIDGLIKRHVIPTDDAIDLALLAAVVTAADTRISRETESQDTWTREIDLYLPVGDTEKWTEFQGLIARMLGFLSGDRWRVYFRNRCKSNAILLKKARTLPVSPFTSVCLFSGGLDSFVGAIDLLHNNENALFVSHYGDASTKSQEVCGTRLSKAYDNFSPRHVRANVRFPNIRCGTSETETTTRARSFLFFSLAVLAASGLAPGATIYVPENGLISLNVPLDPLRIGAWSTRTTHPFYIARWQELLDGLQIPARFSNPYRFKTKGEMLAESLNQSLLQNSLADTVSCSSVTKARWNKQALGHCGYCVPCLIRRAAIAKAFGSDPTSYKGVADLTAAPLGANRAEGEHIRSFQFMGHRLTTRPDLARTLIHKPGPLLDYSQSEIEQYAAVFRRGIDEVDTILRSVTVEPS